jgi:hypothetical protein
MWVNCSPSQAVTAIMLVESETKRKKLMFERRNWKRISRYRKDNVLHSGFAKVGESRRTIKRILHKCAKEIHRNYFRDDLKAPMGNKAKPAFLSKPSVNVYFGTNLEDKGTTMQRASYGFGSGRGSIGLNPLTMRIHPLFEEMLKLMDHTTRIVRRNPRWNKQMGMHHFNTCSVKIYYKFRDCNGKLVGKTTSWHVDVTTDPSTGNAKSDNSQVPGTPVATVTFGASKDLIMKRWGWMGSDGKLDFDPGSEITFRQHNGFVFVLDGEDERCGKEEGLHWMHMSKLDNSSPEDVTFSFSMRAVQMSTEVKKSNSMLAHPKLGPIKRLHFLAGEKHLHTQHYIQEVANIHTKIDKCIDKYKPL